MCEQMGRSQDQAHTDRKDGQHKQRNGHHGRGLVRMMAGLVRNLFLLRHRHQPSRDRLGVGKPLRRIAVLCRNGEIDVEREHRATGITRRVLATLYRYMIGGTEPTRERVLLAGVEGDEHTLGLQMVHDQLAAAGYQTIFDTDLSAERLRSMVESRSPDVLVLGATAATTAEDVELALHDLRSSHPDIPIVLGGAAVGGDLPRDHSGMKVLERIDESVEAVEALLDSAPAHATPV